MPSTCLVENPLPSAAVDNNASFIPEAGKRYPTKAEVLASIPEECFDRSLVKSSVYLFVSLTMASIELSLS